LKTSVWLAALMVYVESIETYSMFALENCASGSRREDDDGQGAFSNCHHLLLTIQDSATLAEWPLHGMFRQSRKRLLHQSFPNLRLESKMG